MRYSSLPSSASIIEVAIVLRAANMHLPLTAYNKGFFQSSNSMKSGCVTIQRKPFRKSFAQKKFMRVAIVLCSTLAQFLPDFHHGKTYIPHLATDPTPNTALIVSDFAQFFSLRNGTREGSVFLDGTALLPHLVAQTDVQNHSCE